MITISRYQIIGTKVTVLEAWENTRRLPNGGFGHSSITSVADSWFGRIGTRRLTPELDALPAYSKARSRAVRAWHEAQYQEAYAAILACHPDAAAGARVDGEIILQDPS